MFLGAGVRATLTTNFVHMYLRFFILVCYLMLIYEYEINTENCIFLYFFCERRLRSNRTGGASVDRTESVNDYEQAGLSCLNEPHIRYIRSKYRSMTGTATSKWNRGQRGISDHKNCRILLSSIWLFSRCNENKS